MTVYRVARDLTLQETIGDAVKRVVHAAQMQRMEARLGGGLRVVAVIPSVLSYFADDPRRPQYEVVEADIIMEVTWNG